MDDSKAKPALDAKREAKLLLRTVRASALATVATEAGDPFATLVNIATRPDGAPILLLSQLSAHTRHLARDARLSLLLAQTGTGDPLAHPRLTLTGRATRAADAHERAALRRRFLARHPAAELYADFGDFSFWSMKVDAAHYNGGFARAARLDAADLLTALDGADALLAAEDAAVAHMNVDHRSALAAYAQHLCDMPPGEWVATGIDPEGIDLACGDLTARVAFPEPVSEPAALRQTLVGLVGQARGKPP